METRGHIYTKSIPNTDVQWPLFQIQEEEAENINYVADQLQLHAEAPFGSLGALPTRTVVHIALPYKQFTNMLGYLLKKERSKSRNGFQSVNDVFLQHEADCEKMRGIKRLTKSMVRFQLRKHQREKKQLKGIILIKEVQNFQCKICSQEIQKLRIKNDGFYSVESQIYYGLFVALIWSVLTKARTRYG